jgi:hypothetical protein
MRRLLVLVACAAVVLGVAPASAQPRVPEVRAEVNTVTGARPDDYSVEAVMDYLSWAAQQQWYYVAAANAYAAGIAAQQTAALVTREAPSSPPRTWHPSGAPASGGGGGVSGCGATPPPGFPAYIIQRESGGDCGAVNSSSGALGPAQILPSHFAPGGGCAGLSYSACWAALWANGAGASNWSLG